MSVQQAETWVGIKARYSDTLARFGAEECSEPPYAAKTLNTKAFVREFRVKSADLGLHAPIQNPRIPSDEVMTVSSPNS